VSRQAVVLVLCEAQQYARLALGERSVVRRRELGERRSLRGTAAMAPHRDERDRERCRDCSREHESSPEWRQAAGRTHAAYLMRGTAVSFHDVRCYTDGGPHVPVRNAGVATCIWSQMASPKSDAELIREAGHEPEAFAELYRRHAAAIHSWLAARTPSRIAVELTAETFAQAAVSLGRFRDRAGGSAAPWLYGIAKNLLRRYLEKERIETRARRRLGVETRTYDDYERVEERAFVEQVRPRLVPALAALPAAQRDAVRLHVVEDLPYSAVATRLGCTEVAARLRVMRGLKGLARAINQGGSDA
jgi:RNA polymerase sigma-70 factor, ECF subfamily